MRIQIQRIYSEGIQIQRIYNFISSDLPPGPYITTQRPLINFQKGATLFVCFAFCFFYNNFTTTALVYTAIHGSYGIVWLMKDCVSPDKRWDKEIRVGSMILTIIILGSYWVGPWLLISSGRQVSPWIIYVCVFMYSIGIALMLGSDTQKYFSLKIVPNVLIDIGWFRYMRNPNYLGEFLIYFSFSLLTWHPLPVIILVCVVIMVWVPGIIMKENRLSRKVGYDNYVKHSGIILPLYFVPSNEIQTRKMQ